MPEVTYEAMYAAGVGLMTAALDDKRNGTPGVLLDPAAQLLMADLLATDDPHLIGMGFGMVLSVLAGFTAHVLDLVDQQDPGWADRAIASASFFRLTHRS